MEALLLVLGIPLVGSAVLAFIGHRDFARDVNVGFQPRHLPRRLRAHGTDRLRRAAARPAATSSSSTR